MLPKEYRLKKRKAFNATYRINDTYYHGGITIFCGKQKDNLNPTKVGFVVSKKIHKRAVKRNRIKRLMREAYRQLIKENKINTKYISIIFVASSKLLEKNFQYIKKNIEILVEKI